MSLPWKRLIRFVASDGRILRGEPILSSPDTDLGLITEADKLQARVVEGDDILDTTGRTRVTDEVVTVQALLGPLTQAEVPILRCVGLNYAKHSVSTLQSNCELRCKTSWLGLANSKTHVCSQGSGTHAASIPVYLFQA